MSEPHSLAAALERGLARGGDLTTELQAFGERPVDEDDARALAHILRKHGTRIIHQLAPISGFSSLHYLIGLFQHPDSAESAEVLREDGLPELLRLYDELRTRLDQPESDPARLASTKTDLLFCLKIFTFYGYPNGLVRMIEASRDPKLADSSLWPVIFHRLAYDHPFAPEIVRHLSDPLPVGDAGTAFLDLCTELCRKKKLKPHPFDTPAGKSRLQTWLTQSDPRDNHKAYSAAAALLFIGNPEREQLLAIAMDHADPEVQMQAAFVSGMLGGEGGVAILARMVMDHRYHIRAFMYLQDLCQMDAIPEAALEPDFRAMGLMSQWLAHPDEYARPPDEIELFDTRELDWPPTNDRRELWLFRYRYLAETAPPSASSGPLLRSGARTESEEEGIGMIGSIPFAMEYEDIDELTPEDIYALHCCWELQVNQDLRAPEEFSIEAGRAMLGFPPGGED